MAHLFEAVFDVGIRGGRVFHWIAEGNAREGGIVSCFDTANQAEGTELPAEAWWNWTRVLTLGSSYV